MNRLLNVAAIIVGLLFASVILFIAPVTAENKKPVISFKVHLAEKKCQIAIWLVNEKGEFLDTVYITKKIAKKGLGNRGGGLDDKWGGSRLSTLPVWAHQRGIDYGDGNYYPPKKKPLPDSVTSATPEAGEFVRVWQSEKELKAGRYFYYIEINQSFDDNESHDYSWYRGQPSVVWKGELLIGEKPSRGKAIIIGHGHIAGSNGKIDPDISTLTTATGLIKGAEAVYASEE